MAPARHVIRGRVVTESSGSSPPGDPLDASDEESQTSFSKSSVKKRKIQPPQTTDAVSPRRGFAAKSMRTPPITMREDSEGEQDSWSHSEESHLSEASSAVTSSDAVQSRDLTAVELSKMFEERACVGCKRLYVPKRSKFSKRFCRVKCANQHTETATETTETTETVTETTETVTETNETATIPSLDATVRSRLRDSSVSTETQSHASTDGAASRKSSRVRRRPYARTDFVRTYATDAVRTDVPRTDVPRTDVPRTDVPRTDLVRTYDTDVVRTYGQPYVLGDSDVTESSDAESLPTTSSRGRSSKSINTTVQNNTNNNTNNNNNNKNKNNNNNDDDDLATVSPIRMVKIEPVGSHGSSPEIPCTLSPTISPLTSLKLNKLNKLNSTKKSNVPRRSLSNRIPQINPAILKMARRSSPPNLSSARKYLEGKPRNVRTLIMEKPIVQWDMAEVASFFATIGSDTTDLGEKLATIILTEQIDGQCLLLFDNVETWQGLGNVKMTTAKRFLREVEVLQSVQRDGPLKEWYRERPRQIAAALAFLRRTTNS